MSDPPGPPYATSRIRPDDPACGFRYVAATSNVASGEVRDALRKLEQEADTLGTRPVVP
jgi:hypothetical protein